MRLIPMSLLAAMVSLGVAGPAAAHPFDYPPTVAYVPVGSAVQVEWGGAWYPAQILSARDGAYLIHYEGWASTWDEWVGPERVRGLRPPPIARIPHRRVWVMGRDGWFAGDVLGEEGGRYRVEYDDGGRRYNEWFGSDRLSWEERHEHHGWGVRPEPMRPEPVRPEPGGWNGWHHDGGARPDHGWGDHGGGHWNQPDQGWQPSRPERPQPSQPERPQPSQPERPQPSQPERPQPSQPTPTDPSGPGGYPGHGGGHAVPPSNPEPNPGHGGGHATQPTNPTQPTTPTQPSQPGQGGNHGGHGSHPAQPGGGGGHGAHPATPGSDGQGGHHGTRPQ